MGVAADVRLPRRAAGPAVYDSLNRLGTQTPTLTGDVAPAGSRAAGHHRPAAAARRVPGHRPGGRHPAVAAVRQPGGGRLVVLLLAARMIAMRRSAELTMRRARGASVRQIAAVVGGGAAVACVPGRRPRRARRGAARPQGGTGAGGGTSRRLAPADSGAARRDLRPGRHRGLAAAAAPAAARRPAPPARRARLVAEATAVAAAVAGIVVFRQQGTQPGSGVNLYTSAAPVLVAVPAVIVVLRVYPVVLRGLLHGSARSSRGDRVPRPRPGGQDRAYPGAARVRAGPRAQRGRVRGDGAGTRSPAARSRRPGRPPELT